MTKDEFIIETARALALLTLQGADADARSGGLLETSKDNAGHLLASSYARATALANALSPHFEKPAKPANVAATVDAAIKLARTHDHEDGELGKAARRVLETFQDR